METIAERIARLPPDKRASLIRQLAGQHDNSASSPEPKEITPASLRQMGNFCCSFRVRGKFDSIEFRSLDQIAPGPGQIQIDAKAFSLNFRDLMIAMNMYPPTPGVPSIMGSDYAGTILACGEGVEDFKPGDNVIALSAGHFTPTGQIVEDSHFCAVSNISAWQAVHKPDNITFAEAAAIPTVFLTSYYALQHVAKLQSGERVLIHTASGGVGLAAVQIAKWIGAEIYATAGSLEKKRLLKTLGIEHVMDSRSVQFAEQISELTHGEGIDVVLNTLSGEAVDKGLGILRSFGRFLQLDKKDIALNSPLHQGVFKKGLTFSAIDLSLFLLQPAKLKQLLLEIIDHFRTRGFNPIHHTEYPITKLGEALTFLSRSKHIGKLVLTYD